MEIDVTRFKQTFFDEAADNAATIESSLLELEKSGGDREVLHRIFRAAHSIKGGSGMFGLVALQHFTHAMESLLDRLREGAIETSAEVIELLFRASDELRRSIDAARAGDVEPAANEALVTELLRRVGPAAAAGSAGASAAGASAPSETVRTEPASVEPLGGSPARRLYRIRFIPDGGIFLRGLDPVLLLRDLAELGELSVRALDLRRLPALAELDAEVCYLGWQLELESSRGEAEIKDVFSFVEDTSEIQIASEPLDVPRAPLAAAPAPSPAGVEAAGVPARQGSTSGAVAPIPEMGLTGSSVKASGPERSGAGNGKTATLRVSVEKLDELVNLVGELVIAQSVISQSLEDPSLDSISRIREALVGMERHTRELQDRVLAVRMVPIGSVFNRFQRLVRDLGQQCNKRIQLVLSGEDTEIDKGIIEQIADPLTHLIRNSIDHGLETPSERLAAGKTESGTLRLTASHQGGSVLIDVVDDGRGIDWQRVRAKAISQGLLAPTESASEEQLRELLFAPGFSTASAVTDISGRGVGMDVVRRNVDALSGTLTLTSQLGQGTRVRIKLPLTLAIVDGLFSRIGSRTFVLPLLGVVESFLPDREQLKTVLGSGEIVRVRGEPIPLVRLYRVLGVPSDQSDPCQALVIIVEAGDSKLGLMVDEVVGQAQVVVKSLETNFRKVDGVMGATILGDGQVGLILDIEAIARRSMSAALRSPEPERSFVRRPLSQTRDTTPDSGPGYANLR